jgi:hypothetical protein
MDRMKLITEGLERFKAANEQIAAASEETRIALARIQEIMTNDEGCEPEEFERLDSIITAFPILNAEFKATRANLDEILLALFNDQGEGNVEG